MKKRVIKRTETITIEGNKTTTIIEETIDGDMSGDDQKMIEELKRKAWPGVWRDFFRFFE